MKAIDIVDIELLTPGSVWNRDNGKQSRVLFITNQNLPEKIQKIHPVQVIYADENDNVMSIPMDDFLSKRNFYNVDPGLESRLGNLLAMSDEAIQEDFELGDESNEDDLTIHDDDEEINPLTGETTSPTAADLIAQAQSDTIYPYPVEYSDGGTGLPQVIEAAHLARATEGYVQAPLLTENKIQHTLLISSDIGISVDTLRRTFDPTYAEKNAVYSFKVYSDEGVIDVDWDTFVGVYPMTRGSSTFYQVIFLTDAQLVTLDAVVEPVIEQVAVVATANVAPVVVAQTVASAAPAVAVVSAPNPAPTTVSVTPASTHAAVSPAVVAAPTPAPAVTVVPAPVV